MEHRVVRSKTRLVVLAAVLTQLAACSSVPNAVNPIAWYRGITGASKNDDLGKGQNEENLKEGGNEPYPNLGTVPDAPETALGTIDRDKLVDSLIADRNNAKYAGDELRAGRSSGVAPPPPASAAPRSGAGEARPAAAAPAPSEAAGAAQPAPAPDKLAKVEAPKRGSDAPPAESSLQSPSIDNPPQGEAVTPVPPPPRIAPVAAAAKAPAKGPPAAAPAPPTDTIMAAPPPPKLAPPESGAAPAREKTASAAAAASPGAVPGARHIADISFPPGSALLTDKLRDTIDSIVKQHNKDGGRIRIVGYGEAAGANAGASGFNLALDRAQAVAVALSDSGVPSKDISVEAAPAAAGGGRDQPRAEVFLVK